MEIILVVIGVGFIGFFGLRILEWVIDKILY